MTSDLDAAWEELRAATLTGWRVGRPSYHDERNELLLHAFDLSERPKVGLRDGEWMAVHSTELGVIRRARRRPVKWPETELELAAAHAQGPVGRALVLLTCHTWT